MMRSLAFLSLVPFATAACGTDEQPTAFTLRFGAVADGAEVDCEDVVRNYAAGLVRGFTVTDEEVADVVAFLSALTDEGFVTNPAFSDPFEASEP